MTVVRPDFQCNGLVAACRATMPPMSDYDAIVVGADKITRFAPNFRDIQIRHITFAPYHIETMFAAPSGAFCHGLLHPDLMGPNRPGPKGFLDMPIPTTPAIRYSRTLSDT
jgi:phytoene dehydrogenase-like protein